MENKTQLLPESGDESSSALLQSRSRELLARNWVKVQPALTAFIMASTPQFSDAEDLLQEVAAEVALRFDDYDPSRPFLPWAMWVAKIKVADFYRAKERGKVVFLDESIEALGEACLRVQESLSEEKWALEKCLTQLTDRSRSLLKLRYFDDLKPHEISEQLGLSPGSVRVTLSRIRTTLAECVQKSLGRLPASHG
ncbi:sigma-70 family RNA polymerase sigma factor [Planctomicrobium piriforme]|nr:sigma-70 family RNA polymerase sigma factor [Planctomicrobium piriforme]